MSLVINSSIPALRAQFDIREAQRGIASSMEALSSGRRVNGAADDAAGLSISTRLETQQRSLAQVVEQAYRGANLVETAEGALNELGEGVQRVRELSLRALNGSLSQQDLVSIQTEITQTIQGMEQIADSTTYNSIPLLSGSEEDLLFEFPLTILADSDDALQVQLPNMTAVEMGIAGGVDNGRVTNEQASTRATLTTQKKGEKFEISVGGTVSEGDVFAFTANGRAIQYEVTIDDVNADNPRRQVVAGLIGALAETFPGASAYSEGTKSVVAQANPTQTLVGNSQGLLETQQIQMPLGFKPVGQANEIYRRQIFNEDDVSVLADGSYLIAYSDFDDSSVKVQKFNPAGIKLDSEIRIERAVTPDIESIDDGGFAIAFQRVQFDLQQVISFYSSGGELIRSHDINDGERIALSLSSSKNLYSLVSPRVHYREAPLGNTSSLYLNVYDSAGEPLLEDVLIDTAGKEESYKINNSMFTDDNRVAVLWRERDGFTGDGPLKLRLIDIDHPDQSPPPITVAEDVTKGGHVRLMPIDDDSFGVLWFRDDINHNRTPVLQIYDVKTDTLGPRITLEKGGNLFDNFFVNAEMVSSELFYFDDGQSLHLFDLYGSLKTSFDKLGYDDTGSVARNPNTVPHEDSDSFIRGRIAYLFPGVFGGDGILHNQQVSVQPTLSPGSYNLKVGSETLTGVVQENSANPFVDLVESFQSDPSFEAAAVQLSASDSGIEVKSDDPGDREPVIFERANGEAIGEVIEEVKGVSAGNIVLDASSLVLQDNQYTLTVGDTILSANAADYADDLESLYADLVSDPNYSGSNFTLTLANQNLVITPSQPIDANSVQLKNASAVQLNMDAYELVDEPQLLTIGDHALEVAFESSQEPMLDNLVQQIRSHPDFDPSRFDVFTAGNNLSIEFLDGAVLPVHLSNRGLPLNATDFVVENLPSGVGVDVLTHEGAKIAVELSDAALARISMSRGYLGAVLNRIDHSISVNSNMEMNLKSANSRIVDADFAKQSASLVQYQIQTQVSQAMIAQANATHRAVMEILKPIVG